MSRARRQFREAKRKGNTRDTVLPLAKNFFSLVHQHSQLKRKSRESRDANSARRTRHRCHKNFWTFARELLNDEVASKVCPQFTADEAFSFYSETCKSTSHTFHKPRWMPAPYLPDFELETGEILQEEVRAVIKHCKSGSPPSPIDQIPYQVFKRCPALQLALLGLFNTCWANSTVPSAWKTAGIRLLAIEDPFTPSNFRPIALTSCIGKLFTSILKNRWFDYMVLGPNSSESLYDSYPLIYRTSHQVGFHPQ